MDTLTACECGHHHDQHHRIIISVFPCDHCTCGDYAEATDDVDTIEDINTLFGTVDQGRDDG